MILIKVGMHGVLATLGVDLDGNRHQISPRTYVGRAPLAGADPTPVTRSGRASPQSTSAPPHVVLRSLVRDQQQAWLVGYLRGPLAALMGVEPADVDPELPLNLLGLDSLKAQAFKQHIERQLELPVPLSSLLGGSSAADLARGLAAAVARRAAQVGEAFGRGAKHHTGREADGTRAAGQDEPSDREAFEEGTIHA